MKFIAKKPQIVDVVQFEMLKEDGVLNIPVGDLTSEQKEIAKGWYQKKNINELDADSIIQLPFITAYNSEGLLENICVGENDYIVTDEDGDRFILSEQELFESFSFYSDDSEDLIYDIDSPNLKEFATDLLNIANKNTDHPLVAIIGDEDGEGFDPNIYNIKAMGEMENGDNEKLYTIVLTKADMLSAQDIAESVEDNVKIFEKMFEDFIKRAPRI